MAHLKPEDCLNFFSEVLNLLKSTHESQRVLSLIVDRITRIYGCQSCAVITIDPETEYLRIVNSHNLSYMFIKEFRRHIGTGAVAKMLSTGKPVLVTDAEAEQEKAEEIRLEYQFRSAACMQIAAEMRTLGYLHADSREPGAFSEADLRTLQSFTDLVSVALNKSYLYEKNLRLDPVDPDTGLQKYAPFLERLGPALSAAEKNSSSLSLLILDIDNFKQMGETYGYESSRIFLKELASVIKQQVQQNDTAGRYGFDEIIVMRENCMPDEGIKFAEKIRGAIENKEFTQKLIKTTVSIGVAAYPQNADSEKKLLSAAKEALYNAQHLGRNRVVHA
jgi:diguanylate cyclase (GGDEF)-like protein